MVEGLDANQLREFCGEKKIQWIFTTPAAPHQKGCAKALVKSCKKWLKIAISEQLLTPLELYTCVLEVANLMNQRPIDRIPTDPDDAAYLCPNVTHQKYHKVRSKTQEIPADEWSSCKKLPTRSGSVGLGMYFLP